MTIEKINIFRTYRGGGAFLYSTDELSKDKSEKKLTEYDAAGNIMHSQLTLFDGKGRTISQEDHFPLDKMSTAMKTEYLDESRKKIDREFYLDGSNNKIVSTYNGQNKFLSVEKYEDETSPQPFEVTAFEYNDSGHLLEVRTEDPNKTLLEKTAMIYDSDSRLVKIDSLKGGLNQERKQEYDAKGRVIKSTTFQDGRTAEEIESFYDDENCTREDHIRADGQEIKLKYDGNGRMVYQERTIPHGGQKQIIKISMEYGENGLLLSESHMDSLNPQNCYTDRYEYEFFPD